MTTPAVIATRIGDFDRERRRSAEQADLRAAAVAVVVLDDPSRGPGVLLTLRTSRLRDHPGQFALPGGSLDPGEDVVTAARRELAEELGLELGPETALGLLDDYPTRSGFVITPVVMAGAGALADLRPSPDEVSEVFHLRLAELEVAPRYVAIAESPRPVLQLPLVRHLIHAPTAAVLLQFREIALYGRETRVDGLEQPVFAWR